MSIGLAYVRCCAAPSVGAVSTTSSEGTRMLLIAATIRRSYVLRAHAAHLQPTGRPGRRIGHVHPPALQWFPRHPQSTPGHFEFLVVPAHTTELGARVADHLDRIAHRRAGAASGRIGNEHRDAGWMQDHRAIIRDDRSAVRDTADAVRVAAGL